MYIVSSGDSYVFDAETLEMISNGNNPDDAAMRAARMSLAEATCVRDRMIENGLVAKLVEVRMGKTRELQKSVSMCLAPLWRTPLASVGGVTLFVYN